VAHAIDGWHTVQQTARLGRQSFLFYGSKNHAFANLLDALRMETVDKSRRSSGIR
jgi:hypothetical protein